MKRITLSPGAFTRLETIALAIAYLWIILAVGVTLT